MSNQESAPKSGQHSDARPESFEEWVDEIVELNRGLSVKDMRDYIEEKTGERYSLDSVREMRRLATARDNRADREKEINYDPFGLCGGLY